MKARIGRRCAGGLAIVVLALPAGPLMVAPAASAATTSPSPSPTVTSVTATTTVTGTGTVTATPAAATVINCFDTTQRESAAPACDTITPTFSCVFNNGANSYTAALGYTNNSPYTLDMPVGTYLNSFYGKGGDPADWGQPTLFPPGTSITAYTVTWTQPYVYTIKWQLGSTNIVAFSSTSSPACSTHPVPIIGSAAGLVAAVLVGVGIFAFANRRAVRRLGAVGVA